MTATIYQDERASAPSAVRPDATHAGPSVSFITPAYNAAATLDVTVRSVIAQTNASWEMLIVDDGSQDDTRARAEAWAVRDSRIRVFAKENGGPAAARNFGLAQARGTWLAFLDADDWIAPRFIEEMLAAGAEADVVVAAHDRVGPDGAPMGRASAPALVDPFALLARRCPIVPVAAMVRARIARETGAFDPTVISSEDWQFWQRVARRGARFRSVSHSLASYRMLPGSLSRKTERYAGDGLRVLDEAFSGADAAGDLADAHDAKGGYLMYAAALAACGGGDPAAVLAQGPDLSGWSFDPAPWGSVIADLAAYAAAQQRSNLPGRWDILAPQLERFYTALAGAMGADGHAARLRLHVLAQIFGLDGLARAPNHEAARFLALDCAAPDGAVAASDEIAVVVAHARGRVLGVLEAPASALADRAARRALLRDVAWRAPLKPALGALADRALLAPMVASVVEIGVWGRGGAAKSAVWTIAARTLARRLTDAPLAVGAPGLSVLLLRDREMPATGVAPRLAALATRGVRLVSGEAAASAARAGRAPRHPCVVLGVDGLALGGGHPAFTAVPPEATIFTPAGEAGQALRAEAKRRGVRIGLRCLPEEALARRAFADAVAWFRAARAELDDPAPGVLFAPGDVDAPTRWAAQVAGFAFGVNPEPDVSSFAQDPLTWRRLEMRAREPASILSARIGGAS